MAKKKAANPLPKLTKSEQDLLSHIQHGYQLETDSLGGNPKTGPEKMSSGISQASFCAFFSAGHYGSPVSSTPPCECNAITNRWFGERDTDFHQHLKTLRNEKHWKLALAT